MSQDHYMDRNLKLMTVIHRLQAKLAVRTQAECDGTQQCPGCSDCEPGWEDRTKAAEQREYTRLRERGTVVFNGRKI